MTVDRQKIVEAAQKFAAKQQYDKAIGEYQRILAEEPTDVRALLKVGDLQVRMGNTPAAIETYQTAGTLYEQQGLHQKAIAVYKQILQINPDQLPLYTRVADLHIKLGLTSDALQALELLAQRHTRTNNEEALVSTFRHILLLDGQHLATRIRLGELLSKMGRGEEAAIEFEAACHTLDSLGRAEEWSRVAERLVFHRPTNVDVLRKLAAFYLERNDPRRALPKIQASFKVNAKDVLTLELLAAAFRGLGQLPKTISVLKEVARIHHAEGRARERNETYQRVLELAPTDTEARDALRGASKPGQRRTSLAPVPIQGAAVAQAPAPQAPAPQAVANDVDEVDDDAIEEIVEEQSDVVFALSQRPPREGDGGAMVNPAIPAGPRVPSIERAPARSARLVPGGPSAEAARLLGEAEIFLKYGLKSKAAAHIARAADLDPNSSEVMNRVREAYNLLGDPAGLLRATVRLAEIYAETAPQQALVEATRALEIDEENPIAREIYTRLNGSYAQSGTDEEPGRGALIDERDVLVAHEEAATEATHHPQARYGESSYDDLADATEIGRSPVDFAQFAGPSTEENPAFPDFMNHGISVVNENETIRAPSFRPGARREIEEGLDEAEFFVTQGLYDDARAALRELLNAHPNHPLVYERLEEIEQMASMQGDGYGSDPSYALADKIAEEVENMSPYDTGGLTTGQIDVDTVLAQFKLGVGRTVSIEDCDTHYDLGIAYKEMGLFDDAIAEFKIATMNPARQCIGDTMIGLCYMEKGDIASALEHFKQGLQAPQRNEREELGLYFEMGNAYEIVGDLAEALYYFQKVDKRDPSFRAVRQRVQRLQGAIHGVPEGHGDLGYDDHLKD